MRNYCSTGQNFMEIKMAIFGFSSNNSKHKTSALVLTGAILLSLMSCSSGGSTKSAAYSAACKKIASMPNTSPGSNPQTVPGLVYLTAPILLQQFQEQYQSASTMAQAEGLNQIAADASNAADYLGTVISTKLIGYDVYQLNNPAGADFQSAVLALMTDCSISAGNG